MLSVSASSCTARMLGASARATMSIGLAPSLSTRARSASHRVAPARARDRIARRDAQRTRRRVGAPRARRRCRASASARRCYRLARALGLAGFVRNDAEGVWIEIEGARRGARVASSPSFAATRAAARAHRRHRGRARSRRAASAAFRIVAERRAAPRRARAAIPADVAPCDDCLRELFDPARSPLPLSVHQLHRLRAALHDRPRRSRTTARARRWRASRCATRCRREYEDPGDRRFHAEPNACPALRPARSSSSHAGERGARTGDAALRAAPSRARARRDRRGQGRRRLPARRRRARRARRRAAARAQAAPAQAVRA